MITKLLERASKFSLLIDQSQTESIRRAVEEVQRNFPKAVPPGNEIELRFGAKENDYFKTGIDGYTFIRIHDLLSSITTPRIENTKVESYDRFRVITYLDDTDKSFTPPKNKRIFQTKNTFKKIDVDTVPYSLRISMAKENNIIETPVKEQQRY